VFGDHVALELPVLAQPPPALNEALAPDRVGSSWPA
jgi:hypothetical protein